jgi:O-antigen ligase
MVIGGWGGGIFEPKLIVVLIVGAILAGLLCIFPAAQHRSSLPPVVKVMILGLVLQVVGLRADRATGLGLMAIGLSCSWIVGFVYVLNSNISAARVCSLAPVLMFVCLTATLPIVLFDFPVLTLYGPLTGTMGTRNALSVFIAQLFPMMLVARYSARGSISNARFSTGSLFVLEILALYVVFVSRTRSAWLMIGMYAAALIAARMWSNSEVVRRVFREFFAASGLALVMVAFLPTTLHWIDSSSPYTKSLATMFSLEGSSGREALWTVALSMVRRAPLFGWGTGSYPSEWPAVIASTNIDPLVFAFLRLDLPLFNDFLQTAVENGLLSALAFAWVFLLYPLTVICRVILRREADPATLLLSMMCFATSVDALVDYPFHRVETSFTFIVALALLTRESSGHTSRSLPTFRRMALGSLGLIMASLATVMSIAFYLRTSGDRIGSQQALLRAASLWPYDRYFNHNHVERFLNERAPEAAALLVENRLRYWPSDPEGHLMNGRLQEYRGDIAAARGAYLRGLYLVNGGRCYAPGVQVYEDFLVRREGIVAPSEGSSGGADCPRP